MFSLRIAVAGLVTGLSLAPLAAPQSLDVAAAAPIPAPGQLPDPAHRPVAAVTPSRGGDSYQGTPPLTFDDILAWEDSDDQLVAAFGPGPLPAPGSEAAIQLILVEAANAVLPSIGDGYDFIFFWMNYPVPGLGGGGSTCAPIKNEVMGLGSFDGTAPDGTYDFHDDYGLAGSRTQGLVLITDLNHPSFSPADPGTLAIVSSAYRHRWGIYLPDLLDGRRLRGENDTHGFDGPCGGATKWNGQVDGQGSINGNREWIGSNPAIPGPTFFESASLNTDIPHGQFSYLELYLMGLVSPAEVDAGMSELRYMDDAVDCDLPYSGPISEFTLADIVVTAGQRVPDSLASQKDFRTAWVIIHQPGDPPDDGEKTKLISILEHQQLAWNYSTLNRSTMRHDLDLVTWTDQGCALAGVSGEPVLLGAGDLVGGTSNEVNLSNAAPSATAGLFLALAGAAVPFKGGTLKPFPFIDPTILSTSPAGSIALSFAMPLGVPAGTELWVQWAIQDAAAIHGVALSNAILGVTP
jgi:hypothetical protein